MDPREQPRADGTAIPADPIANDEQTASATVRPLGPARSGGRGSTVTRAIFGLLMFSGIFFAFAAGMLFYRLVLTDDVEASAAQETEPVVGPEVFARAWELVENEYVDPTAIDKDRMLEGAIDGMLDTLGDEGHTRYMTPEESQAHAEELAGEFVGVGIRVDVKDDQIVVVAPIDNSPAMEAGIQPADVLISVDGMDITGMSIDDVVTMIRGEEGTEVTLTFNRPGEPEPLTFTLTRRKIDISPVSWVMLEGNVADIRLSEFSDGAGQDVAEAVREAKEAGAQAIIFDVRNNPGGFIKEAVEVASVFLPENQTVFISQFRDGSENPHKTVPMPATAADLPVVVLINEGSASSAEIVSGAIKANNPQATVIGTTTFGTGTVLGSYDLGEDAGRILLGTELWLTPEGDLIKDRGIQPDVVVTLPEGEFPFVPVENAELDLESIGDDQLDWALDLLESRLAGEAVVPGIAGR